MAIDFHELLQAMRKAEKTPCLFPALNRLLSCPIERVYHLEADWVSAVGTDELWVTFHPGDGYLEFMAAFRAVLG